MKQYFQILALLLCSLLYSAGSYSAEYPFHKTEHKVAPSTYDFKKLSDQVTAGAVTKYDKAKKIYDWITRSFKYDYGKTIYTADVAMKHHKGVCQALCEVFYHLATAQGIETRIVSGMAKNITKEGHSWIMFTDDRKRKVLADPTWGLDNEDIRISNLYFDMDPRFCIIEHFPAFPEDQLLEMPIIFEDYLEMQKHENLTSNDGMFVYGINEKIFEKIDKHDYEFPKFRFTLGYVVTFKEIPLVSELEIGKEYRITANIKDKNATLGALIDGGTIKHSVKKFQNGVTEIKFTPLCDKPVTITYDEGDQYAEIIEYAVKPATTEQLKEIEKSMPYFSGCLSSKSEIDTLALKRHGLSAEKMLDLCNKGKLGNVMPTFFEDMKPEYTIVEIPMDKHLKVGKPYTFHFIHPANKYMLIQDSNGKLVSNWIALPDGSKTLTMSPSAKGILYIMQRAGSSGKIVSVIAYKVE